MKTNRTIVLLTPGFPENEQDTTCTTFLQDYVLSFKQLYPEIDLKIISFQYPFNKGDYKWNSISVYSAGGRNTKYFNRLLTWMRVWRQLSKINKETKIITLHSFWLTECSLIAQWFGRIYNIKHIGYIIGQDAKKGNKYLRLLNLKKIILVAITEHTSKEFYNSTSHLVNRIIPFGLNTDKIKFPKNGNRKIDILGVGSLIPLKQFDLFIDIIKELKKDFPSIESCIVGHGIEYDSLLKKINDNNLDSNIKLLKDLPHKEVFAMMNESKILLHTSSYEGQGMVMMEALACGMTVVCFDVGRVLSNEKMFVCMDKEMMLLKLKELLSNDDFNFDPIELQTMDNTVKIFAKIYEI